MKLLPICNNIFGSKSCVNAMLILDFRIMTEYIYLRLLLITKYTNQNSYH